MKPDARALRTHPITCRDIRDGIRALGVEPGSTVMAHSSLSAFGWVEGGADAVIDGLLDALGPSGTLVLPTFTWGAFHDKRHVLFDVRTTPCETGRIPETFRKHRDFSGSEVILADGSRIRSRSIEYLRHDGRGNDSAKMGEVFRQAGILSEAQIGAAHCMAVRIRELFRITRPLLERDPSFLSADLSPRQRQEPANSRRPRRET